VAVDGGHIYWTNFNSNTIGRANLDGSCTNDDQCVVPNVKGKSLQRRSRRLHTSPPLARQGDQAQARLEPRRALRESGRREGPGRGSKVKLALAPKPKKRT
jgi:hypothetical protein